MTHPPRSTVYGGFAHVWLRDFARRLPGRPLTLAEVPDAELDRLESLSVQWLWLIGAFQTGLHGRSHALCHPDLRKECKRLLSDFAIGDMVGSPYAIQSYEIHRALGGDEALLALRERLGKRGIKLMLDLVPNHTACDHPWVNAHPDWYIRGGLADLEARRGFFAETEQGDAVVLFGKDPNFDPWTDTAQLDWRNPALCAAMVKQVERLTELCDGLRCDMAMLMLNDVFRKSWGKGRYPEPAVEPWTPIVAAARKKSKGFVFLAEVYWGMEQRLVELGFDWVYDKVLYDRLRYDTAQNVRAHLRGEDAIQPLAMRFLENHDEQRAASVFPKGRYEAAAVIASTLPGPFFVHHGQIEGRKEKLPIQLGRAPAERVDEKLVAFHRKLLKASSAARGQWQALDCHPAWEESTTFQGFVAHGFSDGKRHLVAAVNFAGQRGHCYVDLSKLEIPDGTVTLNDALTGETYHRDGRDLRTRGLFVELPAWGAHLFRFGD